MILHWVCFRFMKNINMQGLWMSEERGQVRMICQLLLVVPNDQIMLTFPNGKKTVFLILSEMLSWRLQKEIFGITDILEKKLHVF